MFVCPGGKDICLCALVGRMYVCVPWWEGYMFLCPGGTDICLCALVGRIYVCVPWWDGCSNVGCDHVESGVYHPLLIQW